MFLFGEVAEGVVVVALGVVLERGAAAGVGVQGGLGVGGLERLVVLAAAGLGEAVEGVVAEGLVGADGAAVVIEALGAGRFGVVPNGCDVPHRVVGIAQVLEDGSPSAEALGF